MNKKEFSDMIFKKIIEIVDTMQVDYALKFILDNIDSIMKFIDWEND